MTELTVIESESGNFTRRIKEIAARCSCQISISSVPHINAALSHCPDILVVTPDSTSVSSAGGRPRCGALLIPGGLSAGFAAPKCVVTYGMSPKNTLTLSSIGEKKCLLALQRELVTASGTIVDRQELLVPSSGSADELLAINGTLLLLGLLPG